jgi:malate dehydrogenase (oxaloacetate-decarboxylating)(NADP+)
MTDKEKFEQACLDYHEKPIPGKIALKTTKPCETQKDLSIAYSPGVAIPCMAIKENPQDVWKYTAKGNLVTVVSDGTAVLGLGNIGPEAGLPVMEGKCILFKRFADIDAIPLCVSDVFKENGKTDAKALIEFTRRLEPTFGGINLEDIAAPACFEVEQELKKIMKIPVFHDDQHGTAIISQAAIINALKILDKNIEDCKFVINGAGAAGIACCEFYITAGAKRENFIMCDSKGVIHQGRSDLTPEKTKFAVKTEKRTLAEAMVGADIFLGLSVAGAVNGEMVKTMAPGPIIFAMANPTPEIYPDEALSAGAAVVGTGRTDFPNQVNNVLGFPGIFRGALDVRAKNINEEMKLAAAEALASLVNEPTPADVLEVLTTAYPEDAAAGMFEGEVPAKHTYVIPKPFDPRVVPRVARYVAEAAMKSNVAMVNIDDLDAYEREVTERIKMANS